MELQESDQMLLSNREEVVEKLVERAIKLQSNQRKEMQNPVASSH